MSDIMKKMSLKKIMRKIKREKQKKKIEQKLLEVSEYETLSVDYEIDKSLLGGIVIRIGNQVLDNSIRAKLDAMTRDLSKVRLSN